jgi:type VI secretion system protein VasD
MAFGCGGTTVQPECDLPAGLELTIESTDRLNPDPRGEPLPTVLRIFQLASIASAETASFTEMWNEHEELLGDALLGMDELTVYPGRRVRRSFERNPDANYLIAMGLYREPSGQSWRVILSLPPPPGEQECAARANAEDEEEVVELVNPSVELYMDDYRIEGTLRLERAESGCVGLECLADDSADGVTDEAGSAAEGAGQDAAGSAADSATPTTPSAGDLAPKGGNPAELRSRGPARVGGANR